MSRPTKKGIDYFSFDVVFFDDKKIKVLKSKYGSDGIVVFIYILTLIYRDNGYYTAYDDDFEYIISTDLNMSVDKVKQVISFLFGRAMLNSNLAKSDAVLTSHGIQLRFQEAVKARGQKNTVEVDGRFWVLDENETQNHIKVTNFEVIPKKNCDYSEKNPNYSMEKVHKVKESKVNESKVNNNAADSGNHITDDTISIFKDLLGHDLTDIENDTIKNLVKKFGADKTESAALKAMEYKKRSLPYVGRILENQSATKEKTAKTENKGKYRENQAEGYFDDVFEVE